MCSAWRDPLPAGGVVRADAEAKCGGVRQFGNRWPAVRSWLTDERLRVYPLVVLGLMAFGFGALLTAPYGIGKGGDCVSF